MISHIDHLVLTVRSLEDTCSFYKRVLKFERSDHPGKPTSLRFGICKLNVHQLDHTFEPKAHFVQPGSSDLCLITTGSIQEILDHLCLENVAIEAGPIERHGAQGEIISVYFRDPDQNLIEVAQYL